MKARLSEIYFYTLDIIKQVKTHLQTQAAKSIAVGFQHQHEGLVSALILIQKDHGIQGLWRGANGAVLRNAVGSAVLLSTFSMYRDQMTKLKVRYIVSKTKCSNSNNYLAQGKDANLI